MPFLKNTACLLIPFSAIVLGAPAGGAIAADNGIEKPKLPDARIRPGRKHVDLQIYGHVNQAFLHADNGIVDRQDLVDNDNSESRIGFRGRYKYGDWSAGVRIELGLPVNTIDELNFATGDSLGTVAADSDGESDFLAVRWLDSFIGHKKWGSIHLGFGNIATNGVADGFDLSGTSLFADASVNSGGGEFQFGNAATPLLGAGFEVDDFFESFDGNRDSRISYESARIAGFQLKVAVRVEDEFTSPAVAAGGDDPVSFQPDASINYENEWNGWKFEGAVGWRHEDGGPGATELPTDSNVYIGSASLLAPFGTNVTVAAGTQDFDTTLGASSQDEDFYYVKAGQRLNIFEFGETRLSIDYFEGNENSQSVLGNLTDTWSVGGGIVQLVKPLGAELYASGRVYDINAGNGTVTDELFVAFSGMRIRF